MRKCDFAPTVFLQRQSASPMSSDDAPPVDVVVPPGASPPPQLLTPSGCADLMHGSKLTSRSERAVGGEKGVLKRPAEGAGLSIRTQATLKFSWKKQTTTQEEACEN